MSSSENSVVPSANAQTGLNTVVSTAISSVDSKDSELTSKDSILTSIPSEAPIRELVSVGSDSIMPLIEETFENSVTGNHGGNAAIEKPFRQHARCSAQKHIDAPCSECESIENNLKQENETTKKNNRVEKSEIKTNGNRNEEKMQLVAVKPSNHSSSNENVWQVAHIDKYDASGKFTLSPITICSAQTASTLTNNNCLKFGVDSTSFIVLNDENENASHFLPNITSNENTMRNGETKNLFDRPCDDCCFCNPSLHHKRRNSNEASPKKCNFCSSRQQSTQTTPATSTRQQDKNQATNDASARSSIPMERIYESKYRSNHTHIRTHSKESDTINTQCTKKTNKKVRKTLLSGSDDRLNANTDMPTRNKTEETNEINGNKTTKQKSTIPKLPPATNHEWITNSTESATSSSSSNSTGSSNNSQRRQNSKSVPNLPKTERWQNSEANSNSKQQKTRTNSRYQNFYGNATGSATDERTAVTSSESKSKSKPPGNIILGNLFLCVFIVCVV